MPRSFRFDYFKVPPHDPHPVPRAEDKEEFAQTHKPEVPGEQTLHYGKAFAETEEILKKRREQHQSEERGGASAQGERLEARGSAPIGAVPGMEEPPRVEGVGALWEEAQRSLRLLQQALTQAGDALFRLVRLPLTAARMTRHRLV